MVSQTAVGFHQCLTVLLVSSSVCLGSVICSDLRYAIVLNPGHLQLLAAYAVMCVICRNAGLCAKCFFYKRYKGKGKGPTRAMHSLEIGSDGEREESALGKLETFCASARARAFRRN